MAISPREQESRLRAIVKTLFPANGSVRSRLRFLRTFGLRRSYRRRIPRGVRSVLFVCHDQEPMT